MSNKAENLKFSPAELREKVLTSFESGYNCAEAIVSPFLELLGEDHKLMRAATPFGAGIGGRRDLCGIITGGEMIIGLVKGRTDVADMERKTDAYKAAAEYFRWFKQQQKVRCSEIVQGKFTGHTADCVSLIERAQAVLLEIIND